ncbi:MAG: tail fiber protein [Verrucomicrobiota bacterium]
MSDPYVGEIRMVGFNFAPSGWAFCNGQLLPISQNAALFALIGTFYGGNGTSNFALPNMQSCVPIHQGTGNGLSTYLIGQTGGVERVALQSSQMPIHTHSVGVVNAGGNEASPSGNYPAIESTGTSLNYSNGTPNATLNAATIGNAGGTTPVSVIQPYLCVNFIIALVGIFPSRN